MAIMLKKNVEATFRDEGSVSLLYFRILSLFSLYMLHIFQNDPWKLSPRNTVYYRGSVRGEEKCFV